MNIPLLDLTAQYKSIRKEINSGIMEVLKSGHFILGENVNKFEEEFARYSGTRYAVSVANGTDALELSLRALGIGKGDCVITTPFTFIATVEAIVAVGAVPLFVDIDLKTFNMDLNRLEEIIIKSKVKSQKLKVEKSKVILLTPQGERFEQKLATKMSKYNHIILICGHYEGVDERVKSFVADELSIGDYILTGGELPALVIIDAVVRLLPGALGDSRSASLDTFQEGLLKYPQYTRPRVFKGISVPDILLSGNHKKIEQWRKKASLIRTLKRRPDLLKA